MISIKLSFKWNVYQLFLLTLIFDRMERLGQIGFIQIPNSLTDYKCLTNIIHEPLATAEIFWNLILRNHWTWTWKILDCLTGHGLILWYNGLGLEKYLNYLAGLGFVLYYIRIRLEKYLDYLGFELVLWYIGLGINTWTRIKLLDSD